MDPKALEELTNLIRKILKEELAAAGIGDDVDVQQARRIKQSAAFAAKAPWHPARVSTSVNLPGEPGSPERAKSLGVDPERSAAFHASVRNW